MEKMVSRGAGVFAYCAAEFEESTRKASGVAPLTCPPVACDTFNPALLERRWLLYFDLHGLPERSVWYGDDGLPALTAEMIRMTDLRGTVIFAVNCYLADEGSPMLDALLDAGALYVIGGAGPNYGGATSAIGASYLGKRFRELMRFNNPLRALRLAKALLVVRKWRDDVLCRRELVQAAYDALAFRAFYRERIV